MAAETSGGTVFQHHQQHQQQDEPPPPWNPRRRGRHKMKTVKGLFQSGKSIGRKEKTSKNFLQPSPTK